MPSPKLQKVLYWLCWGVIILFVGMMAGKAALLDMTIDECDTYLNYLPRSYQAIILNTKGTANNHILFTLILKSWVDLTDTTEEILIRLPSVLSGLSYFYFGWRIFRLLSTDRGFQLVGLLILAGNPYLFEFFSLARGYGLAMGLMLPSLYFGLLNLQAPDWKRASFSLLLGLLMVYANFSFLFVYLSIIGSSLCWLIIHQHKRNRLWLQTGLAVISLLLLASIITAPILELTTRGELYFGGKTGFWTDTLTSLAEDYLAARAAPWLVNLLVFSYFPFLLIASYLCLYNWRSGQAAVLLLKFITLLLWGCTLAHISAFVMMDVLLPIGRTAMSYYVLLGLLLPASLMMGWKQPKFKKYVRGAAYLLGTASLIHLILNYHPTRSFEWSVNQSAKKVLTYIKEQNPDKMEVWMAAHWWHLRPFYFYTQHRNYYQHIRLPDWTQELPTHHPYQYFYVRNQEDAAELGEQYVLEKKFKGGLLYQLKSEKK